MQVKNLLLTCFTLLCIGTFNSCTKDTPVSEQQVLLDNEYQLMRLAYYRDMPEGETIGFRFYESPRIITISKNDTQLTEILAIIDESKEKGIPVRITINKNAQLLYCENASVEEINEINAVQLRVYDPPKFYRSTVPGMTTFNNIFAYMQSQGCATGTSEIEQCISFQYVIDGCYARAHKMKQIMNNKYNYNVRKVFSYEGASGYLAVDAGDCCVYWWYHVAPLVNVMTAEGVKEFVMDPSMFDGPVTIDEWTGAQENTECSPYADFGYSEITPGNIYSPGGWTDDDYSSTDWTLYYYSGLETCD